MDIYVKIKNVLKGVYSDIPRCLIFFIVYYINIFIVLSAIWSKEYFGSMSMEQLLFHLSFGVELIEDTPSDIINSFSRKCIIPSMYFSIIVIAVQIFIIKVFSVLSDKKIVFFTKKGVKSFIDKAIPIGFLIVSMMYIERTYALSPYIKAQFADDYFANQYISPSYVRVSPKNTKNLVFIYLESIDDLYKSKDVFGENLLDTIDSIDGVSFAKYRQVPGTTWTAAAIIATQCGIPLKTVSIYQGHAQGEQIKYFLPGAICMGDILKDKGYHNVLMAGANLKLAGVDRFATSHGYDEIYGKEEWSKVISLSKDISQWGLHDDSLFQQAKIKLRELQESGKRFNLTIMTIDTHGPSGKISRSCRAVGAKSLEDIVKCMSKETTDFIKFIADSGYMKDTNIVVVGDHLLMSGIDKLDLFPGERYVFNKFISEQSFVKNREEILHFDLFPTTLEFIGFDVEGGRLGLGYSAFSEHQKLPEKNRYEETVLRVLNSSDTYLDLWKK